MTADEKYHPLFFTKKVVRNGNKEEIQMVP